MWKRLSSCWSRGNSAGVDDDDEVSAAAVTVAIDVRSRRRSLQSLICCGQTMFRHQSHDFINVRNTKKNNKKRISAVGRSPKGTEGNSKEKKTEKET